MKSKHNKHKIYNILFVVHILRIVILWITAKLVVCWGGDIWIVMEHSDMYVCMYNTYWFRLMNSVLGSLLDC